MNSDDNFSPIVIKLLSYFFNEQATSWFSKTFPWLITLNTPEVNTLKAPADLTREQRLYHILQDSMFVQPAYALAGQTPPADSAAMQEFERLFSLALYIDDERAHTFDSCGGYAYDRKYIHQLMEKHSLKRWQENGILSGYTDYSSVYMGFGSFFANILTPAHIPYIYSTLQIQALFNQLSLHHFNRLIESATKEITNDAQSLVFHDLRKHFIKFTNLDWFHELTPQIQGKEIYTRQSKALNLAETYAVIKDKMQQADDYLESEKTAKIAEEDLKSSRQGVFVTAIGVPIASFALLTNTESIRKTLWDSITTIINEIFNSTISSDLGVLIYSTIASATVGYYSLKYLKSPVKKGKSNDN